MKKKHILIIFTMVLMGVIAPLLSTKNVQAATPKLSKKSISMYMKESKKLSVKNNKKKKKVKWSSSDKSVVTVSKNGKINAKKIGKAVITAKVGKKKLKCKVSVRHSLKAEKKSVLIKVYGHIYIDFPEDKGYSVKCDIKDKDILKLDSTDDYKKVGYIDYYFEAKKTGTTYVTFTNKRNNESVIVKVKAVVPNVTTPKTPFQIDEKDSEGKIYRSAIINNIELEYWGSNSDTFHMDVNIKGTKTYDICGDLYDGGIEFLLVVYDQNNKVVYSETVSSYPWSILVSQDFSDTVYIRNLKWDNTYRVEIYQDE